MKKFIRLLLVLYFTLSFAQLAYCTDFSTHTNEEYKFSIDIPNSWDIMLEKNFAETDFQFIALNESNTETFYICAYDKPVTRSTLARITSEQVERLEIPALVNMTNEQVEYFAQTFIAKTLENNGGKYLGYKQTSVNGYPCLLFQFEAVTKSRVHIFSFIEETKVIQLFHVSTKNSPKSKTSVIKKIVNSFKMF